MPRVGRGARGMYVKINGSSRVVVTGGSEHLTNITIIDLEKRGNSQFKNILPAEFGFHAMIKLKSLENCTQFGFLLIQDIHAIQCIYLIDKSEWQISDLTGMPVRNKFSSFGYASVREEWVVIAGGHDGTLTGSSYQLISHFGQGRVALIALSRLNSFLPSFFSNFIYIFFEFK